MPEQKKTKIDIELMKVQIYSDRCHVKLTLLLSFVLTFFVSFSVLFYTIFYTLGNPSASIIWQVGISVIAISTFIFLVVILWDSLKDIKTVSAMIEMVKEGKPLPKLEDISRKAILEKCSEKSK